MGTTGNAATITAAWDLVYINEFEVVCSKVVSGVLEKSTKYNEQYTLLGNRGTFFDTKTKNTFEITEIECDLTDADDPSTNDCSIVKGTASPITTVKLKYLDN